MLPLACEFELPDEQRFELTATLALVSWLWAGELGREDLEQLVHSELRGPWQELGGWLPDAGAPIEDARVEELAEDYCRVLVGPRDHLPPVQSVWEAGRFESEAAVSMQQFMESVDVFQPCVPIPDHLAVQLQLASRLFSVPLTTLEETERTALVTWAQMFIDRHLQWPAGFLDAVEQSSQTRFYQGLCQVTRRLLFVRGPSP